MQENFDEEKEEPRSQIIPHILENAISFVQYLKFELNFHLKFVVVIFQLRRVYIFSPLHLHIMLVMCMGILFIINYLRIIHDIQMDMGK